MQYESVETFLGDRYLGGRRNETTVYNYQTSLLRGVPAQANYVDLSFVINVLKQQQILYQPNVYEVLKFAWIQYFAFFLFLYALLYHFFYGFVIRNKVFDCVELSHINVRALIDEKKRLI